LKDKGAGPTARSIRQVMRPVRGRPRREARAPAARRRRGVVGAGQFSAYGQPQAGRPLRFAGGHAGGRARGRTRPKLIRSALKEIAKMNAADPLGKKADPRADRRRRATPSAAALYRNDWAGGSAAALRQRATAPRRHRRQYRRPIWAAWAVCAEGGLAIGRAHHRGRGDHGHRGRIVAVRHPKPGRTRIRPSRVVSPCGSCRENHLRLRLETRAA